VEKYNGGMINIAYYGRINRTDNIWMDNGRINITVVVAVVVVGDVGGWRRWSW
jgi:hypothetical protein